MLMSTFLAAALAVGLLLSGSPGTVKADDSGPSCGIYSGSPTVVCD